MSTRRIISGSREHAGKNNSLPRRWSVAGLGDRSATLGLKRAQAPPGACSEEFLAMDASLTGREFKREDTIACKLL